MNAVSEREFRATMESVEQLIEDAKNDPECYKCRRPITELSDARIVTVRVDGNPMDVWVHAAES